MSAIAQSDLLFNWEPPRRRARALVIFITASLVLHALCFYIFQIVYPPAVVLVPPPARVSLISNQTEDGRALLRWLDAEDPALLSTTIRPRNRDLPRLEHVPSYMSERTVLKQLPPLDVDLTRPSVQPPEPVRTLRRNPPVKTPAATPTAVEFSEEIAALGAPAFPPTKFSATTNDQPANIRFRIAVNAHGQVQYAFPLNSSGDAALDVQAHQHIAQTTFANPPNESLTWGIATVEFGSDVARSTSTPPP
jgi:hypothetical protein